MTALAWYVALGALMLAPLMLGANRPWAVAVLAPWIALGAVAAALDRFRTGGASLRPLADTLWHPAAADREHANVRGNTDGHADGNARGKAHRNTHTRSRGMGSWFFPVFGLLCLWFEISNRWVSVDLASSRWHVNQLWLMLGISYIAYRAVDQQPQRAKTLCRVIVASALLQAILGFELFAAGSSAQVFFESIVQETPKGTFANRNNAAAYFNLGLACATGLMLAHLVSRRQTDQSGSRSGGWLLPALRFVVGGALSIRMALVVLVIALIATRSRAGNVIFLAGLALTALWTLGTPGRGLHGVRAPEPGSTPRRILILFFTSVVLLDVLVIGSVVGFDRVVQRLAVSRLTEAHGANGADLPGARRGDLQEETLSARIRPALAALGALDGRWLVGTGGKTFQWVFPAHKPASASPLHYEHAHSDPVEHLIEGGLTGFGLLCGLVVLALRSAWQVARRETSAGLRLCGLALLLSFGMTLIHSVIDFPTQIFSIALTLSAMAGCVVALHGRLNPRAERSCAEAANVPVPRTVSLLWAGRFLSNHSIVSNLINRMSLTVRRVQVISLNRVKSRARVGRLQSTRLCHAVAVPRAHTRHRLGAGSP